MKNLIHFLLTSTLFSTLFVWHLKCEEARIILDCEINNSEVKLAFDTAATESFIFEKVAQAANIKYEETVNREGYPDYFLGYTEQLQLGIGGRQQSARLAVIRIPEHVQNDTDGVVSWNTFRDSVLVMDFDDGKVHIQESLPEGLSDWNRYSLNTESTVLSFAMPKAPAGEHVVYIDTGSPSGVKLSHRLWSRFLVKNSEKKSSIRDYFTPEVGEVYVPVRWSPRLVIGDIRFLGVTVEPELKGLINRLYPNHMATLGLDALVKLHLVIDGERNLIFLRERTDFDFARKSHNMLGAVFVPSNKMSNDLLARVAEGSLAEEVGIKNDDVLLCIEELDVTRWKTDPTVSPISRFWEGKEGTSLKLRLRRKEVEFDVVVELSPVLGL